ncbi:MAG: DUF4240 domain-containing protein [Chloroflexota bacterium]
MIDPIRVNDVIALREDIPEHSLSQGRIGQVLEVLTPDEFKIEFVDSDDQPVAKPHLKRRQFISLRHEGTLDGAGFWKLIEDSRLESGGDIERQHEILVDKVASLSIADIFAYGKLFPQISELANHAFLWDAASIICNGCSSDGFDYFRPWLIAQGKAVFYDALQDPEILVDHVQIRCDGFETYGDAQFELINYVDSYAYRKKMGERMPTLFAIATLPKRIGEYWAEATVEQQYPKLAAKFHGEPCE